MLNRVKNFINRTDILSKYTGNTFESLNYILSSRYNRYFETKGIYKGLPFKFRGLDYSAVKEVLHDDEYKFVSNLLEKKSEPFVIDIGAHIGLFALKCFSVNKNASILSVEASPGTFEILRNNVSMNTGLKWRCINRAAWKNEDDINFSAQLDSMSHKISSEGEIKVKGLTLPSLMTMIENKEVDLMKIDIEGAEEAFLSGNDSYLGNIKNLIIELHPNLCNTAQVEILLKKYYPNMTPIQGRISTKPLLLCQQ
jgi:FkbM family methyltransferase